MTTDDSTWCGIPRRHEERSAASVSSGASVAHRSRSHASARGFNAILTMATAVRSARTGTGCDARPLTPAAPPVRLARLLVLAALPAAPLVAQAPARAAALDTAAIER